MAEAEGDILTLDEVAAYLKAGKRTIYRLAASREMPAASESVFMIFSWGTLLRKSGRCKAQTAAGLVARRGFATPQMLFLPSNPSGKAAKTRTRCCPPCPGRQHELRWAPRSWQFAVMRTP